MQERLKDLYVDDAMLISPSSFPRRPLWELVEDIFVSGTTARFKGISGQLDPVREVFRGVRARLKKKSTAGVITLMRSYSVLYGKEPLEI